MVSIVQGRKREVEVMEGFVAVAFRQAKFYGSFYSNPHWSLETSLTYCLPLTVSSFPTLRLGYLTFAKLQFEYSFHVQLQDLAVFFGHLMETALRQLVVIVVVAHRHVFNSSREGPESVELHVFTELHRNTCDHQASGQAVSSHTFSSPEKSKVLQVLGMEKQDLLSCFRLFESEVHFKRCVRVGPEGKRWQKEERIPIGCNVIQKYCFLFL